jgi:hypothetical protein
LAVPPEPLRVVAAQRDEFDILRLGQLLEQRRGSFEKQVFGALEASFCRTNLLIRFAIRKFVLRHP